ncbi:MAG: hypothetical protein K8S23_09075 [Candidatus Cloacimonetes bacterium]|nr:hypothetical protein [Candidatus Cloacimonadota bacterium]
MTNNKKVKQIDRRIIFLLIFIGVALPLLITIGFKIEVTENVQKAYDLVNSLPPNTKVLISFDYDPASKPELHPMAKAVVKHCLERDYQIICTALWPMGVRMCSDTFESLEKDFPNKKYGIDFVNLGYKVGGKITIQKMGRDFRSVFPTDTGGINIDEMPIMDGVTDFSDLGFVFSFSAGDPGIKDWVMIAHDTYSVLTSGGTTGVSAPAMLPYVNEQGQLTGLLGALKAAAEYELLIDSPGSATNGMDAQSIAHLIIIIFIVIGNVNFYKNRKKNRERG